MASSKIQSDSPVESKREDRFQRFPFAKRIGSLIKNYKKSDSLTIGIYGKWGEGKSSVMNFIKLDLSRSSRIICVDFNPWLFTNTEQLLSSFFNSLAFALDKSIVDNREKLGRFLLDYSSVIGALGSFIGLGSSKDILESIGKKLGTKTIEESRAAIDGILSQENLKVVVFLDDIDRLNDEEIYSVFKLVKLIADFKNTIYVLAFDDNLVAKSLSKRYSGSGHEYLEKIIQVPLKLPNTQKSILRNYSIEQLNSSLKPFKVTLEQVEIDRFVTFFDEHFLRSLATPRVAIRYANSIHFSVPLLIGEVNIIDLLIIEGIKVIYPNLYDFMKNNNVVLTQRYDGLDGRRFVSLSDNSKELIDTFLKIQFPDHQEEIKALLIDLFPQLKDLYENYIYDSEQSKEWYSEKRICSGRYFEKYFNYSVPVGEISDIFFDDLIQSLSSNNCDLVEISNKFNSIDIDELATKFLLSIKRISPESGKILAKNLSKLGSHFPNPRNFFIYPNSFSQVALFIDDLIEMSHYSQRLDLAIEIVREAQPLNFAFEIWRKIYSNDEKTLNKQDYDQLSLALLNRSKSEFTLKEVVESIDEIFVKSLMGLWADHYPDEIKDINSNYLKDDDTYFLKLLHSFSTIMRSSDKDYPYYSNFTQSHYESLQRVVDIIEMFDISVQRFGKKKPPVNYNTKEELSDSDLVGLFQKIHIDNIIDWRE
ncbi:MAG: hypothetical protein Tsb0034_21540 [Ekhidna sp.]